MERDGFGQFLHTWLERNELSIRELSRISGVDPGHISKVINEKIKPTPSFIRKIAPYIFGVSYSQLMKHAGFLDETQKPSTDNEDVAKNLRDTASKFADAAISSIQQIKRSQSDFNDVVDQDIDDFAQMRTEAIIDDVQPVMTLIREIVEHIENDKIDELRFVNVDYFWQHAKLLEKLSDEELSTVWSVIYELAKYKEI